MHKQNTLRQGFTIVELLIVVVVIAILAAITVVAYRNVSDRANLSAASSEASQAAKKIQLYYTENESYPTSLSAAGITNTDNLQYAYSNSASPKTFCITATSGNKSMKAGSTQTTPTEGGCAGHGVGGVSAITNLAINPRGVNATGLDTNDMTRNPLVKNVTVPATPDGVTTAIEQRIGAGGVTNNLLNAFNIDGLGNSSGKARSISAWVRVNASGYRVGNNQFPGQDLPANTWVRVQTIAPIAGTVHSVIHISKSAGNALESDRAWMTGVVSVEGSQHYAFVDGNSPGWIWNGAPGTSSSTGPAP